MKNIKFIISLTLISQLFLFSSCDQEFEEVNTNPNDPTVVPAELLLAGTLRATANEVQNSFLAGEAASTWIQHLGKLAYNDADLYIPRQGSIQNFWDVMYSVVIKDANVIQQLAEEEENSDLQGVALVIKAYAYQLLADAFGNIPMTEAGLGDTEGNFTPAYDSCSDVYTNIIDMLTQASSLLNGTGEINSSQDILYGGDWMKWKKFANSLKFRVIMRASGIPSFNVGTQLQQLVNSGNLFESNDDEATLEYEDAIPNANPFFEALVDGGRTSEWGLGQELVDFMEDNNDPRLSVYAQEVGGDGSGNGYVGKPPGIRNLSASPWNSSTVSLIGEAYLEPDAPAYFMTYSQLNFLMAEAAERGYISGGSAMAATYYLEGIAASYEANGISSAGLSAPYSGGNAGLRQIAEQEWVALYMQGYEAWAEYRRTGYPDLPLAIDAEENRIPTRFNYPTNEQSLNNESYTAAVNDQGPDTLTNPTCWQ